MVRIFISYSRVDKAFIKPLIEQLRRIYGHDAVWLDEGLHAGDIWWEEILKGIASSTIFLYLLSNDSVQSDYCQAEFTEARRLQKQIITVQVRDRTKLTPELANIHYVDISTGSNSDALATLVSSINKHHALTPKRAPKPLWQPATPKPADNTSEKPRPDDAPDIDTPTLAIPAIEQQKHMALTPKPVPNPMNKSSLWILGVLGVLVLGVVGFIIFQNMNKDDPKLDSPTAVVSVPTETPTPTVIETETALESPTVTPTPEPTLTPSEEPTPDLIAAAELIVKQMTAQAIIDAETATAFLKTQEYELQLTESANLTATATGWTHTPTPDITASIVAFRTEQAATVTQAWVDSWTPTPTNTYTPSPTPTPNATATLIAFRPQTNADWTPVEREFDGVTMVLVPAGCFMMGSGTGDSDERPVHEQCFDAPFWIDKTEVTQAQFARLGGVKANDNRFTGDDRPVERITWFEARDFCELRGGRLPTEAEWEYAAGGVESWVYPWGDIWDGDHTIHSGNSNSQTADVGSRPSGASWVGALDMSGNVWEWTNSLYEAYPYDVDDGRERDTENSTDVLRVLRGGSWLFFSSDYLRVAVRGRLDPHGRSFGRGFRCVLPVG